MEQGFISDDEAARLMIGISGIINPFTGEIFTTEDEMGDFWDSHSLWGGQLLAKAGMPEEIINIVSEHHRVDGNKDNSLYIYVDRRDPDYRNWTIHRLFKEDFTDPEKITYWNNLL